MEVSIIGFVTIGLLLMGLVLVFTVAIRRASRRGNDGHVMDFSRVDVEFQRLKAQFEAGTLTEAEFKAQLEDLMIQDEEGKWWMIGYETGQWYYHDGEKWVQHEPPKPAPTAPQVPVAEQQRVPQLFRERSFLLHFLPTVVAGVVWWLLLQVLQVEPIYWWGFNLLLAAAVAFVVWLVLRDRVARRWQVLLALAAGWEIAGRLLSTELQEKLVYDTAEAIYILTFETGIIFVLGLGSSVLVAKMLKERLAAEP